jgi:hypothetical protein
MRGHWQLKPLVRRMVLSDAYVRSSNLSSQASSIDPENRLLWRANRKRITAESIRDSMLVAAGILSDEEPTEPVADKDVLVTKNSGATKSVTSGVERPVRSVYLPVIRGYVPPLLKAIDVADPNMLVGRRPTTNVPGQALTLLNSEHVNRWAQQTADLICDREARWDDRIDAVFRVCLSREPTAEDREVANHYLGEFDQSDDQLARSFLGDLVAAVFASAEFRMLD